MAHASSVSTTAISIDRRYGTAFFSCPVYKNRSNDVIGGTGVSATVEPSPIGGAGSLALAILCEIVCARDKSKRVRSRYPAENHAALLRLLPFHSNGRTRSAAWLCKTTEQTPKKTNADTYYGRICTDQIGCNFPLKMRNEAKTARQKVCENALSKTLLGASAVCIRQRNGVQCASDTVTRKRCEM